MMRKKPMLAYPVSDKPIDYTNKISMQPKLDGVRCLIQYDGTESLVAYSRTGKVWKNINHILYELIPFFKKYPNVILDGELYNHALRDDFEKIISCVRKTKPTDADRAESRKLVQFHCYDIVDETLTFEERYKFVFDNLRDYYGVRTVVTQAVASESLSKVVHQQNLDAGYEGSILRTNDAYQCKRSHSLRKFKDFHDAEAVITDWVEGKGKRVGTIGKFMAIDADGNTFGMPVMDNFKKLQTMFKEMQSWVGKEATFTYFERTKANSYRHPLFKAIRDYE
jgi:DNA ligase 1